MIAAKIYGEGNAIGIPAGWPEEVAASVNELPAGFDLLFDDRAAYDAYLAQHQAAFDAWKAAQPAPEAPPAVPHRVLKDTLIERIAAVGELANAKAAVDGLSAEDRFRWDNWSWVHSDNAQVRALITAIGLDPDTILAPDPLAP